MTDAAAIDPARDFVCYLEHGWHCPIRPGEPTRAWMDRTSQAYAYRCLPLTIANTHGWEITTPAGFFAYWNGGPGADAVVIRPDADMPAHAAPVSLFGAATLTIHVQGLFRTPPGWDLLAGPIPNSAKDGIAALSGIIETDWCPYTFTINWRFTRADLWVRFEPGEAVCFIQPVMRHALAALRPRFAPLSENADLARQYRAWVQSRDAFQAEIKRTNPSAAVDQWQKRYHRGIDMDARPGVADHQTRLRLSPFAGA